MLECPNCEIPIPGFSCRECGWSKTQQQGTKPVQIPENQRQWTPPQYPAPAPGDDALIRAEIARAKQLLGGWGQRAEAIDPEIRAKVGLGGPLPIVNILPAVLDAAREIGSVLRPQGAPR